MKKLIAILLCLAMLFGFSSVSLAVYDGTNRLPIVMMEGRGPTSEIWDADGNVLFPFEIDTDSVAKAVAECIPLLTYGLTTGNYDPWVDRFVEEMGQYYTSIIADKNGNLPEGTYLYGERDGDSELLDDYYGIDYRFRYDWRRSACVIADDLNGYIQTIKKVTGKEKVCLVGRCMGANVLSAYLEKYGCADVDTAIYYTSTAAGTYAATNAFCGTVEIDAEALVAYIENNDLIDDAALTEFIRALIASADSIGGVESVSDFLTKFLKKVYPELAPKLLRATYASFPSFWGLVDTASFESAKEYIFSGCEEEYKGLINVIDRYHYDVQVKLEDIINSCKADGMRFGCVVKYNSITYPFFEDSKKLGDDTVSVWDAAFGGTYADFGSVLSEEQLQSANMDYVSSDHMIDATTCAYKDSTWFVKDLGHAYYPVCVDYLLEAICNSEKEMTVNDDENYPQFLKYDSESDTISPLVDEPATKGEKENFFKAFARMLKALFTVIRNYFSSLSAK